MVGIHASAVVACVQHMLTSGYLAVMDRIAHTVRVDALEPIVKDAVAEPVDTSAPRPAFRIRSFVREFPEANDWIATAVMTEYEPILREFSAATLAWIHLVMIPQKEAVIYG